jgi:hypothetical protein
MSGRNVVILGLPNEGIQGYASFGSNGVVSIPTGMEPLYLGTEEPSDKARMLSIDPKNTQWVFSTGGIPRIINGSALVGHNLQAGSQVRFLGHSYSDLTSLSLLQKAPNAIASSTNATGVVGNVDEQLSFPDGLVIAPTVTTNPWDVRFSWPTFTPNFPKLGASMACFSVEMNVVYVGLGATAPVTLPKVTVQLWENGSLVLDLGYRGVAVGSTSPTSQIFTFPFNFASLANPDGRDLECKVLCTPGTSFSGSSYINLEAITVYYESQLSVDYSDWDSGWLIIPGDTRPSPSQPTKSFHYIPAVPWTNVSAMVVLIRTDQTVHNPLITNSGTIVAGTIAANPNMYIDIGIWCMGDGITCSLGAKNDLKYFTPMAQNLNQGQTIFGQTYAADEFRWRAGEPINLIVTRDELKVLQDQLGWRRGHSGAFYVALEPDVDIGYQTFSSAWCTLVSMSAPQELGAYRQDGQMQYTLTIQFQEKL